MPEAQAAPQRVVVVMPAYNAAKTLERTYADIPHDLVDRIILVDDVSKDETVDVARQLGLDVIIHRQNLGYGGNQKTCYQAALADGADVVVMLHPDYQYDATRIPALIAPILSGEPISFDLFPKDRATGVYTDMTRTYVVGDIPDELREYHRLCKEALDRVVAAAKPGVNGRALFQITCDLFAEHGYPTQLTKQPGEVLDSGFFHSLGHGVGLEVHEEPGMGRLSKKPLVAGDAVTVEPGLYRAGYGGVRLEDIVLVTENGAEVITDYPYDLEP